MFRGTFVLRDSRFQIFHVLRLLCLQIQVGLHIVLWNHCYAFVCLAHLEQALQAYPVVDRARDHPEQSLDFGFAGLGQRRLLQERLQLRTTVHHLKSVELRIYRQEALQIFTLCMVC